MCQQGLVFPREGQFGQLPGVFKGDLLRRTSKRGDQYRAYNICLSFKTLSFGETTLRKDLMLF